MSPGPRDSPSLAPGPHKEDLYRARLARGGARQKIFRRRSAPARARNRPCPAGRVHHPNHPSHPSNHLTCITALQLEGPKNPKRPVIRFGRDTKTEVETSEPLRRRPSKLRRPRARPLVTPERGVLRTQASRNATERSQNALQQKIPKIPKNLLSGGVRGGLGGRKPPRGGPGNPFQAAESSSSPQKVSFAPQVVQNSNP